MKDIYDLIEFSRANPAVLTDNHVIAQVVQTEGSAYRRAGARMLLKNGCKVFGTVSGGCLEESIGLDAERMGPERQAKRVDYDSRSASDLIWGTATGCGGLVSVLLKRWDSYTSNLFAWIDERLSARKPVLFATVIRDGNDNRQLGRQLAMDTSGQVLSQVDYVPIQAAVMASTAELLCESNERASRYQNRTCRAGHAELLLEYITPRISLLIIGAGDDARPVVESARQLGWSATVVDHRPAYVDRRRFPSADRLLLATPESYAELLSPDPWTMAVVMTHNWHQDAAALAALSHFDLPYIGIIGNVTRTEKILAAIPSQNGSRAVHDAAIHYPAGLDIGAQTPEEIALSLVAEIQAVLSGRHGESLKKRKRRLRKPEIIAGLATAIEDRVTAYKSSKP